MQGNDDLWRQRVINEIQSWDCEILREDVCILFIFEFDNAWSQSGKPHLIHDFTSFYMCGIK